MKIFTKKNEITEYLNSKRQNGLTIGFVPTMGALHNGHLSLIDQCNKECNVTVASIFVNPTQFNNPTDLKKYPRNIDKDCELLNNVNCDVLFHPSENEMYPEPDTRKFDFGILETVMEGKFRPGHFNGVAQIVSKLFDIVNPHKAYFGQKDFQQLAVIKAMVKQYNYNIEIVPCPTVREIDGLAMSSRNERLNKHQRQIVPVIAKSLFEAKNKYNEGETIENIKRQVISEINLTNELKLEYIEIVDNTTLEPVVKKADNKLVTACIAAHAGDVRLIDNVNFF